MKKICADYSSILQIVPILSTTENIQTRISEIESVFLPTIRHDTEITKQNLSQLLESKPEFDRICEQIDNLESMVERIKSDLNVIQRQVDIAEEELDIPEKKIDILLKSINIFAKPRDVSETNWNHDGFYSAPNIFKTEDYFKSNENEEK